MSAAKFILKALNSIISVLLVIVLAAAGCYSAYALYDNARIYSDAGAVQEELLALKPSGTTAEEVSASFEELLAINSDVCAWLTLDGTAIDYPILQGENNLSYINTDVYGDFALSGSIFLDSACSPDLTDSYSLIYGHHMDQNKMFGDLDLYKEEAFFNENTTGSLILPDRSYKLEIFAYLLEPASEAAIFSPGQWQADISGLVSFAQQNAVFLHEDTIHQLLQEEHPQVLALSTCSSEYTDARTVILAAMEPLAGY